MQDTNATKWDGKSRGGSFGYLFFVKALRFFGVRFAYFVLLFVAFYFIFFAPKATAVSWDYHRKRLGYGRLKSAISVYWHFYTFAQTIVDKLALRIGLVDDYSFEYTNSARFLELIDSGSGVVMIGAHVGCWEAGAQFFGKYGRNINIVMLDEEHQNIKEVLDKNTIEQNYKIIPVNQDTLETMVRIRQALSNSEIVCFNGDRFLQDSPTQTETFLGGKVKFPQGPFRIASKCHVPVVFYYAMKESGQKYHFYFEEASDCKDSQKILSQYIESLEGIVKKYPEQWFNFYQYWED